MKNYYQILNVHPSATQLQIKRCFRNLSKSCHPDLVVDKTDLDLISQAEEKFKEINEAYATLSNPQKRKRFDKKLQFLELAFSEYLDSNTW